MPGGALAGSAKPKQTGSKLASGLPSSLIRSWSRALGDFLSSAAMMASALVGSINPTTRSSFSAHQTQASAAEAVVLSPAAGTMISVRPSFFSTLGVDPAMNQPIKRLVSARFSLLAPPRSTRVPL